jgi:hypothetical protein
MAISWTQDKWPMRRWLMFATFPEHMSFDLGHCAESECPSTASLQIRPQRDELPKLTEMGGHPQLTLSANALYVGQVVTSAAAKLPHSIGEFHRHQSWSESIMLRMVLLGVLIPLGVGALAAMELRTPTRTLATAFQPPAETTVGISDSHAALAKADRLEITYARSETPTQPDLVDERTSPSEATTIGSLEAQKITNRPRHYPKTKKVVTAALPKSKPKTADIKRTAIPDRSKAIADAEPCRLKAFGGLQKALNSSGCEI